MLNFTKLLGIGDVSKAEVAEAASGNQNLLQRLVKGLADIFVPIIPQSSQAVC